jgi:hypothetical protein
MAIGFQRENGTVGRNPVLPRAGQAVSLPA